MSHSDTRLSVQLNGFELHTYNRSNLYKDLEEKFGLEPGILPQDEDDPGGKKDEEGSIKEVTVDPDMDSTEYVLGKGWRDLIPVIKVGRRIECEKYLDVFLNRLIFPLESLYLVTGCYQQPS